MVAFVIRVGCVLALVAGCAGPVSSRAQSFPAVVRKVIDGDTLDAEIRVLGEDGRPAPLEIRVRIIGIDTPETNSWDRKKSPEPCALTAKRRVAVLLSVGAKIRLVADPQRKRGNYNRHLFYVETSDGLDLGLTLIREGLAREVNFEKKPYARRDAYREAAKNAASPVCD